VLSKIQLMMYLSVMANVPTMRIAKIMIDSSR